MSFNKEAFEALLEREGVMDFIWARTWEDISGTEIGIYELANDRYGVIFRIFPPVYASKETEKKLKGFFRVQLPEGSSIQIFSFASRNLSGYLEAYSAEHNTPSKVDNQDILKELKSVREEFLKRHVNESVFENKGIDLRFRNFVNLVAVTIPTKDEHGKEFSKNEVINIFSRVYTALSDFGAKKFRQSEYVALMREILVPDSDIWAVPEDKMTYINNQVVDNNSILTIDDKNNVLGIGKQITEEEYKKLLEKEKLELEKEEAEIEIEEEDDSIIGFLSNLFKKKEKRIKENNTIPHTNWYAKVLTSKIYPPMIDLIHMLMLFNDFFGQDIGPILPCPFFLNLTIYVGNRDKQKLKIQEKAQWNMWQTQHLGESVKFFPKLKERAEESEIVNYWLSQGEIPLPAMWSMVIMDNSIVRLSRYAEGIRKKFAEINWILQEETVIPHWLFLYSLPLQFEPYILLNFSKRMNTLFTANCASIAPLVTGAHGIGSPVLSYIDRIGQVSAYDIFAAETNYNFIVIGTSGSGKSYSMADFFTNNLMNGAKIRIIDVGRSYKHLCSLVGGQYIEFTEEANICLNPFTKVDTTEDGNIHPDELQTLVPLVGLMAGLSLHPKDIENNLDLATIKGYISEAIVRAFQSKGRNAGMQDVGIALEQIEAELEQAGKRDNILTKLIRSLTAYTKPQGEYFRYFNGHNNLDFESDFVVLELEEIDQKEGLKSVVLAAIAQTISTEFFLGDRTQKKIMAVDEAWSIVDDKNIMRFLETMARRIRKYYGALGIITQKIGDFFKNQATRDIFDNTSNKIFLRQDQMSIQAAEMDGSLPLDKGMIELMKTIKSKPPLFSELLIKQEEKFFIAGVITDRVAHWIYTNHKNDVKVIYKIMKMLGVSELDARLIKGYSEFKGITIEEEFNYRLANGLIKTQTTNVEEEVMKSVLEE